MSFFDLFEIKCHLLNATWWKSATLLDLYEELDRGIDVNVRDRKGLTPIYYALMDALQQAGLTVLALFGVCTLAAAAPWVYLLCSERSR